MNQTQHGNKEVEDLGYDEKALVRYEHYSLEQAERLYHESLKVRYRVTTINWTSATENDVIDYAQVHRNLYRFTLKELIAFIEDIESVAENVLSIECEERNER
jgi:hypothetical protein